MVIASSQTHFNPAATAAAGGRLDDFQTSALVSHPKLYKPGRMKGTREMVIRPNYLVIYQETSTEVTILRVLHAARQWP
jgi:plasmid stabilization system protein ParE